MAFGLSMIIFQIMTSYFLGEGVTHKTMLSLGMAAGIVGLQLWK